MNGNVPAIRDFINAAVDKQFMRDFSFRLISVNTAALALTPDEIVYAFASNLPGRNISQHDANYMGLPVPYAGSNTYVGHDSYQVTFIIDEAGSARQKLERASRIIFNDATSTGDYRVPDASNCLTVATISPKLEPITYYTLRHAQLRNVGDLNFDYRNGNGNLIECQCTFAFAYYEASDGSSNVAVTPQ